MENREINVSGTLVWYYYICPREVWLIGHQITPDQDNANVSLGRFIQNYSYPRERKELAVGHSKMDVFKIAGGELIIGEVKKTSKYRRSARIDRKSVEKQREEVLLGEETEKALDGTKREILRILYLPQPPHPVKIKFCKNCAYAEFCWS